MFGGGNTGYGYPTDPINQQDLDGRRWWNRVGSWLTEGRSGAVINATCSLAWGWGSAACAVIQIGGLYLASKPGWQGRAKAAALSSAVGFAGGGLVKAGLKTIYKRSGATMLSHTRHLKKIRVDRKKPLSRRVRPVYSLRRAPKANSVVPRAAARSFDFLASAGVWGGTSALGSSRVV